MITIFFVKLTGMKEYTGYTCQHGSVRNVVSYGLVNGWIDRNGMDILVSNNLLFVHLLLYSKVYQI